MAENIEVFLQRAKNFDNSKFTKKTVDLAEKVRITGVYPCDFCDICDDTKVCGKRDCLAWYRWFQYHWQNIQKSAGKKDCDV